jgi:hypothetical protein
MATISPQEIEDLGASKIEEFKKFLSAEPPADNGESLIELWKTIYDDKIKSVVVETQTGLSDDETNRVFPYEKLQAIIGDGGNWKWPRMWQKLDELERRGKAYRPNEKLNFQMPNKNPNITPQNILVVGGGPIGMRLGIELVLGGHKVTIYEKRRETKTANGDLTALGFTNRINRPHMWPFVRNDLARLNGKDFMSTQMCYPVFTEPDTSSIGIDELQLLLLKNALMLGVDFRLGVGFNDAKVVQCPKTARPRWHVDCSVDAQAAADHGMPEGKSTVVFDSIVGADGPRSTVRETQTKYLGTVEKRKFMDCVGIVANVRKVPRKRLKEMGFEYGQEPKDMNRTKMVFRDFFNKLQEEADAELENFIYYKAAFHYYTILTPKRSDLIKHGLSGKVYHHTAAREGGADDERARDKMKLKQYCAKVLKVAGIPVDETAENGGFVNAPNDCMAFDFAECWNTKQSMAFNLPPEDYNVEEHGPWCGKKLYPFVALCGDALLEPFWPMGLGLKRGWQAVMDTCYAVDNLYNRTMFAGKLEKDPDYVSWDDHFEQLEAATLQNFEYCNRLVISDEYAKGEYKEGGLVMSQLKKKLKDAERPEVDVEIDPKVRYAPLAMEEEKRYKRMALDDKEWLHPRVQKELYKKEYYDEMSKKGGAKGEIEYTGKKLHSVEGKTVAAAKTGYVFKPPARKSISMEPPIPAAALAAALPKAPNPMTSAAEIAQKSKEKQQSLMSAVMASKIDGHIEAKSTERRRSLTREGTGLLSQSDQTVHEIGHLPPTSSGKGIAAQTEAMWDRMTEKHLSPSQEAELAHIRHMISALGKSLESYKKAEKDMLIGDKK